MSNIYQAKSPKSQHHRISHIKSSSINPQSLRTSASGFQGTKLAVLSDASHLGR